jgi:hypothetical protein
MIGEPIFSSWVKIVEASLNFGDSVPAEFSLDVHPADISRPTSMATNNTVKIFIMAPSLFQNPLLCALCAIITYLDIE